MSFNRVIAFDLDDTLYSEREYQFSGFNAVALLISKLYSVDVLAYLVEHRSSKYLFRDVIQQFDLPSAIEDSLIQIYRYHFPKISLHSGVQDLLHKLLNDLQCSVVVITDGRSVTQRLKLDALGLSEKISGLYVSEEIGASKPNLDAFLKVEELFPSNEYYYIGDNPKKDFQGPNKLGWCTIGVRHIDSRVHPLIEVESPKLWVDHICEVKQFLC